MKRWLLAFVTLPALALAQPITGGAGSSVQLPLTSLSGGTDYSPAALPHWRAAIQNVVQGNSNTNLLVVGDSIALGSNQTGVFTPNNFTYYLAADLTAAGVTANNNGFCGISTASGTTGSRINSGSNGDSRLALGSWNGNTTLGLGDILPTASATTASAFVYTPGTSVNTFQALLLNVSGSTTFTPTGGTPVTDSTNGYSIATMTAGSLSTSNTLSAAWASGTSAIGCEGAYNSAVKQVNIYNAGFWGAYSTFYDYSITASEIQTLAPSLTIIDCCVNDINSAVAPSSTVSNISQVVTSAKISGDVVIDDELPFSGEVTANGLATNAALQAYAIANNIPFVDTYGRWGTYALSNSLGFYSDNIHPTQLGYGDRARALAKVLTAP